MKNFINSIIDRIHGKPLLVKPVVSNSVICDCCNDYGYVDVIFGFKNKYDSQILCPKCNGDSAKILNISSKNYGDDGVGLTSEQIDELI